MKHILTLTSLALILGSFASAIAEAADLPAYTRRGDVVYGRKYGNALTMDVLTPMEDHNGVGVIFVVSSSLASSQGHIAPSLPFQYELLRRGYTVFAVVHSSQPKFTVPEILKDLHKAVRFIRYHGKQHFDIDVRTAVACVRAGARLAMATDSHEPGEFGDFSYHAEVLAAVRERSLDPAPLIIDLSEQAAEERT